MKRLSIIALLGVMILNTVPVSAQEITTPSEAEVPMTFTKDSYFTVTLPEAISASKSAKTVNYNYSVEGDISADKVVTVNVEDADSSVDGNQIVLSDATGKTVNANITMAKNSFAYDEIATKNTQSGDVSVASLPAGRWSGVAKYLINLDTAEKWGTDVSLTSDNLATYGISNSGDVEIPSVVTDSDGTKHKVTSIGRGAFQGAKMSSVVIPESVSAIEDRAFANCASLKNVTLPSGISSIKAETFSHCSALASIELPVGLTSIETGAFTSCTSLTDVVIPDGVTSIGGNAFSSCSKLENITVPSSVTDIGIHAFSNTKWLTNKRASEKFVIVNGTLVSWGTSDSGDITIPDSVSKIGASAFSYCDDITSVTIPGSVESIGDNAFENCSNLRTVTIKDGVKSIGGFAFSSCNLYNTNINIPSSVISIGDFAFDGVGHIAYSGTATSDDYWGAGAMN